MKIFFPLIRILVPSLALLCGCSPSFKSGSDQIPSVITSKVLSEHSKIRVFHRDGPQLTPLTELNTRINGASLPEGIVNGSYGQRLDSGIPQKIDLLLSVYNPSPDPTGDFYYEVPILTRDYEVSNIATALSWILRFGFDRSDYKISQNLWNSLRHGVDVFCQDCEDKTNSQVLDLMLQNNAFMQRLVNAVKAENPPGSLHWAGFQHPAPLLAYSEPVVGSDLSAQVTAEENDLVSLEIVFLEPRDSSRKVAPSRWSVDERGSLMATQNGGNSFSYRFSYTSDGTNYVEAVLDHPLGTKTLAFAFDVSNKNRPPVWSQSSPLQFQANRKNTASLNDLCSDPDPGTLLSYNLVEGPVGLVVFPDGTLSWSPVQGSSGTSQLGDFSVRVECIDDDTQRLSSVGSVLIRVAPDHLPSFKVAPAAWNLSEGQAGSFLLTVEDLEEDPVVIEVKNRSQVRSGLPEGSGLFTVTTLSTGIETQFRIDFTPSFLQAIGGDSSITVTLSLHYEGSSGLFDPVSSEVTRDITLNFMNMDDPPTWSGGGMEQFVSEDMAFANHSSGVAVDSPPYSIGSGSVIYSLESPATNCDWPTLVVDPATGEISGTPVYSSARLCSFRVVATDEAGLTATSAPILYTIDNVNRPVIALTGALNQFHVVERKNLSVNMKDFFQDLDIDEQDPEERLRYTCLDCASLGAIGIVFSDSTHTMQWTPDSSLGRPAPYVITVQAEDMFGSSATTTFEITVEDGPAAVQVTSTVSDLVIYENLPPATLAHNVTVTVAPASGLAIDQYIYQFSDPVSCVKISGGGCRVGFMTAPASLQGDGATGPQDFVFSFRPDARDGDGGYPSEEVRYLVTFQVFKADDPTLVTEVNLNLTVRNVNQNPSELGISSLGSTGAPYTYGTSTYLVSPIDAARDRKAGSTWMNNYKMALDIRDGDGANDSYSYSLPANAPGSLTGNVWNFKIPNCVQAGTSQVNKTYTLTASDGRGGTISRDVQLVLRNISPPGFGCL